MAKSRSPADESVPPSPSSSGLSSGLSWTHSDADDESSGSEIWGESSAEEASDAAASSSDGEELGGNPAPAKKNDLSEDEELGGDPAPAEESDSSEDEVPARNTVGDVPLKWYDEEEHIGYDVAGRKIRKQKRKDKLESFLEKADDPKSWRTIHDDYNDEDVTLTTKEVKTLRKILEGKTPLLGVDPYPDYVDWFDYEDKGHPLSNAPEPKRRFIPSKWEHKKVLKYVRAIRKGLIKFDKPKEEPRHYLLWGDDSNSAESKRGPSYIPAPKPNLAGHDESYNPPVEYIPTQEEINSYQLMYEEDRPKFIPRGFTSLRSVPAYENALKESFERCLDLYLCPRTRKKRLNIDPESLKPKLPNRKDLRPYPTKCYIDYKGHTDCVVSISVETSGQWLASGSRDGTVRVWEVETGRCLRVWDLGEKVKHVAWNPSVELPILAVTLGQNVLLLNTGLGNAEEQMRIKKLLHAEESVPVMDDAGNSASIVSWIPQEEHDGIRLKHQKDVSKVEWHRKGDYFTTVVPRGDSRSILIHQLSKKHTHNPFRKVQKPVAAVFHPTRSVFFIATEKDVRVYDLIAQKLIKKLDSGFRLHSSIAVHPGGDNIVVGSREGKLGWFDMDLSSKPYKTMKVHPKDIENVAFHRSYPLFASCSQDCTAYVFHGMVYSDLNQNPLIVPLEILRGHANSNGGVYDCKFHPRQPWLFTAGADSLIKLYCN